MSRFADRTAEREITLPGNCQCTGTPHDTDRVWVQGDFSARDVVLLQRATRTAGESDDNATVAAVLLPWIRRWNLLEDDGSGAQITADTLDSLRPTDLEAIIGGLSESVMASSTVPNPSGAPSVASPQESASPTPA